MSEEKRKILEMLAEGKITVEEAEKLLAAISSDDSEKKEIPSSSTESKKPPLKYLRVFVEPASEQSKGEKVNIRIPLKLIRAGLKWASFIPKDVHKKVDEALQDKGIDMSLSQMTPENIEELIENLNDLTVEVEGKEKVRIFCE